MKNGSLEQTNPEFLKKWDFSKNKILPSQVSRMSAKKIFWKCPTCGYEYEAKVCDVRKSDICGRCKGNKFVEAGRDGTYTVYCHVSPSGKVYVGFTGMPIKTRFGNGKNYSPKYPFGKAILKYGWENFEHRILETGLTKEQASEKEIYYINKFNSLDPEFGYNIATGGTNGKIFGRVISEETRKKMSESNKGKKRSKETIENLSKSHIGLKSGHVRAVDKYDIDGNFIESYESVADALRKNCIKNHSSISNCCSGKIKTAGGFKWKYKNE